jgi:hypothetical protein
MRIPRTRPLGSVALATVTTLLVVRHTVDAAMLPGFLVATLAAFLAWPAIAASLPAGSAWRVTPGG